MTISQIELHSANTLVLGAVAYDPKVVTIWEGFKAWFASKGLAFDYVLYSHYERLVQGHFAGEFHVAWNSPLAWLEADAVARERGIGCRTVGMRDSDQDLTSVILTRVGSGVSSLHDLRGKIVGVGASDSPQATLIPLEHIARLGLVADEDFQVHRFDRSVGKHGDQIGGERDAARALMAGEIDAACIIDSNHLAFVHEGTLRTDITVILDQTAAYDHCNFTVLDDDRTPHEELKRFVELLLGMRYDDPSVRPLLDLEGLKRWKPGRTEGYALLHAAVERMGTIEPFLEHMRNQLGAERLMTQ